MTQAIGITLALACAPDEDERRVPVQAPGSVRGTRRGHLATRCARPSALFASKLFTIGMLIASGAPGSSTSPPWPSPRCPLVQAALAGGVLLAVMAERTFGLRISRKQWVGIILTAVGLLLLGVSLPTAHGAHLALIRCRP